MALRLRTNGAPLSGALFVSNPRRRKKASTKRRRKAASTRRRRITRRKRNPSAKRRIAARKAAATRKRNARRNALALRLNRRNTAAAKRRAAARKAAATRRRNAMMRSRAAKKAAATRKRNARRNALALRMNRRKRNGTKRGMVRKTARRAYMKRNRRNGTHKGMVRKTARRAYVKRRNSAVSGFQNKAFAGIKRFVGKIPVIGSTAQKFVAPLAFGAAAGVVHYYGVKAIQRFAPRYAQVIAPVQFSVAGSFVAALLLMGNKIPGLKKVSAETRQQVAAAALVVGGGLDAYRALSRTMGDLGAEVPLYDFSGLGVDLGTEVPLYDYSGLGVDLGDGGAFDVVPLPQDMGSPALLTGSEIDYSGAAMADAMMSPVDLSVAEGNAALAGPASWHARFGHAPVVRTRHGVYSPYAGRPGHRFGWLIKLIGFDRFRRMAALPPGQRMALLAEMKQQAVALADSKIAAGEMAGIGMDIGATMTAGATL